MRIETEQAAEVRWGGALLLHPINQRKTAAVTKVREAIVRQTGLEVRTLDDFVRRRRLDRDAKEAAVAGARLVVVLPRPDNSIGQGTWCDIGQARRLQAAGKLALYVHGAKIGVLVDYEGPEEVGKDLGMHIAFSKPRHLSKADVPLEVVNEERKIQEARAKESGKPPEIAAKMVEGSLNKFLAEISLMGQPFVKDDKQTIEKMLASKKAKMNGYAFLVVGEGIAKEKDLH